MLRYKNFASSKEISSKTFEHEAAFELEAEVDEDEAMEAMWLVCIELLSLRLDPYRYTLLTPCAPLREKLLDEQGKGLGTGDASKPRKIPKEKKPKTWTQQGKEAWSEP